MSKTIIRIEKNSENPYTMIHNDLLKDKNISWKAKGILAYLLSLPDDWKIYESELVAHATDGIGSLGSGIDELIENNYIRRIRNRNDRGHLKGYTYSIYEAPTKVGTPKNEESDDKKKELDKDQDEVKEINKEFNDDEFGEIAKLYQSCIGQTNGLTPKWIEGHLEEHGFEWLKNALLEAEKYGKRNKAYVNKILNNWKTNGGMSLGGKKSEGSNGNNGEDKEELDCEGDELHKRAVEKYLPDIKDENLDIDF